MSGPQEDDVVSELTSLRPVREGVDQGMLFDLPPSWQEEWAGMPAFDMKDARPEHKIVINFMSQDDIKEFARATGLPVTAQSDSAWYPHQEKLRGEFYYDGPKMGSKYPACIPSKGRADVQNTGRLLEALGVEPLFFVEETEYDEYVSYLGEARVIRMPFHDLGQGSIPARNYIWDWAVRHGHERHWVIDDNITAFTRTHNNRRLLVKGGGFFRAIEDFVDRYENLVMAGPHDQGFVSDRHPDARPITWNTRVYSCILLDTSLEERWRGRYNEDTDLSLRLLKKGYATCVFNALCMNKPGTVGSKSKAMKGGNTDNVYNNGDHRRAFAESLAKQHPDVVEVVWKFNRWHHQVDYSPFKRNRAKLRPDYVPRGDHDDYGMTLRRSDDVSRPPPRTAAGLVSKWRKLLHLRGDE